MSILKSTFGCVALLVIGACDRKVELADCTPSLVLRLEEFGDAFLQADKDKLGSMLSEDYIHTNGSGLVLSKGDWLSWIQTERKRIESRTVRYDEYQNSDVRFQIYDDVAVITGSNFAAGIREGEAFSRTLRFTHTWLCVDGEWKRASFHDPPLVTD